ncbi:MAG: DUF5698 domain-containing protein [Thermoanaerobacteraceae bacterium]|nr:DUF5698 domain-containing protein [Thermoanaerobacteraceae bacterium]
MWETLLGCILIALARITDVSCATVRTLMLVRGKRTIAAAIGLVESTVYLLALSKVMSSINNVPNIIAYAVGFASGNYIGSMIEEKIAVGTIMVQVIPSCFDGIVDDLRKMGYGITVVNGMGKDGPKEVLNITMNRKDLPQIYKYFQEKDCRAFITVLDTRDIRGGYLRDVTNRK